MRLFSSAQRPGRAAARGNERGFPHLQYMYVQQPAATDVIDKERPRSVLARRRVTGRPAALGRQIDQPNGGGGHCPDGEGVSESESRPLPTIAPRSMNSPPTRNETGVQIFCPAYCSPVIKYMGVITKVLCCVYVYVCTLFTETLLTLVLC